MATALRFGYGETSRGAGRGCSVAGERPSRPRTRGGRGALALLVPLEGKPVGSQQGVHFSSLRQRFRVRFAGAPRAESGSGSGTPGDVLLPLLSEADLVREAEWLGRTIASWLDEEWCEQDVHDDIGDALCQAYLRERMVKKNNEATSILLQLSDDLKKVDFSEAFVNPYDVSNKALECLMFKSGVDVCCQSDADKKFLEESLKNA